jgi:cytochrome c oxidase assembly protein subunit 15
MKKLVLFSISLTLVVIVLGAYTRLTDAGLGCPDWPGCYGFLTVPNDVEQLDMAHEVFPERPVEADKAWSEMIHRYFAGALGIAVFVIAVRAFFRRHQGGPLKLPLVLLALVIFQGALGMWTVTLNLLPVVVMGHLLGGFSVLACLFLLYLRLSKVGGMTSARGSRHFIKYAFIGLFIVIVQIALGGWVSANYAALACTAMPICEGNWAGHLDFLGAYSIPAADNYEFGAHDYGERITMHLMHRLGAVVTLIYLVWLCSRIYVQAASSLLKRIPVVTLCVLGIQVLLGVSNVVFSLPLVIAMMHNAVAAMLLMAMVLLTYIMYRQHKEPC